MKNAWPSENKGERVRTGAVKRVVNVSVYSAYLMKFRLLSTAAPVHPCKGEYIQVHYFTEEKNNNNDNDNNNSMGMQED